MPEPTQPTLATEAAFPLIFSHAPDWPHDANFAIVPATPETMAAWLFYARLQAPKLRAGDVNWPGIVRSAVAQIEALEALRRERGDA
jgi:hypothetical protein